MTRSERARNADGVEGIPIAASAQWVWLPWQGCRAGGKLRSVRLVRRIMPVTADYDGTRLLARSAGRLSLTPFAVVVVAILGTDIVFAVDLVPPCRASPATRTWCS